MTTDQDRKRPGRPPGTSDTRDRILVSARELFARNGIDKTSIRAIAAAADVDPALVHHYFGTKTQLFAAAIHIPIDPMAVIGPLREVPVEQIGLTCCRRCCCRCGTPRLGKGFIATLRSMLAGNDVSLVRSFLQDVITAEVGSRVDDPPGSGPDPGAVRRVATGRRRDGALHPRTGAVQVAAGRADRRDHRAESAALPHRRTAGSGLAVRRARAAADAPSSSTVTASSTSSTGMPSSIRYARRSRGL